VRAAIDRARNILVIVHSKDAAGKRVRRALYETVRGTIRLTGVSAMTVETHGGTVPVALAAKRAGYALGAATAVEARSAIRGYKV
jgi:hypothetical protein